MSVRADLLSLLVCPACQGDLAGLDAGLVDGSVACAACSAEYPLRDGIPILLPADVAAAKRTTSWTTPAATSAARRASSTANWQPNSRRRARTERPLRYTRLMREKFARGVRGLPALRGATVLDACCGSGMDAEMLAAAGARVIALDISEGMRTHAPSSARGASGSTTSSSSATSSACRCATAASTSRSCTTACTTSPTPWTACARWRASPRGPSASTSPPTRSARRSWSASGLAQAREDAGNRVARLDPRTVARALEAEGFAARSATVPDVLPTRARRRDASRVAPGRRTGRPGGRARRRRARRTLGQQASGHRPPGARRAA